MTRQTKKRKDQRWVDVDEDVAFAQHAIQTSGLPLTRIADKAGCAVSTVRNIADGATRRPQNATIRAICVKALGYERPWMRNGKRVDWKPGRG